MSYRAALPLIMHIGRGSSSQGTLLRARGSAFAAIAAFVAILNGAAVTLHAQPATLRVTIRYGNLNTDSYPSPDHPSEWLQVLHADVRDSSGNLVALPSGTRYDWGVDFCSGNGFQYSYSTGPGLAQIAVDGNLRKNVQDCCQECAHQAYFIGVRVMIDDFWIVSNRILVPNIRIPESFELHPSFPNPFNDRTTIRFDLPQQSHVRLDIADIRGRHITRLADRSFDAGEHRLDWVPLALSSGTYVCRMIVSIPRNPDRQFSRRMTYAK